MSPVRGLLALISEIEKIYGSLPSANQHAVATECARLRAWSVAVKHKQQLSVCDGDLLDARLAYLASVLVGNWLAILFDDSADAIFAKGSNIIATVHLHALQAKFRDVGLAPTQNGDALDDLLQRMHWIEQELEVSSEDVLEYPALQRLNLMVSLQLMELQQELAKVCKNAPEFHALCVDLCKIQQRLALDQ
jgi:hypothetical protein